MGACLVRQVLLGAAATLSAATACLAQTPVELEGFQADPFVQTSGGVPQYCGIEFTAVFRDRIHRNGAVVGMLGSFVWASGGAMLLKVYGSDFNPNPVKFDVSNGFVVLDGSAQLPPKTFTCEERTGFCGVYANNVGAAALSALIERKPVSIGFQRTNGKLDIVVPVALTSATFTDQRFSQFLDCLNGVSGIKP